MNTTASDLMKLPGLIGVSPLTSAKTVADPTKLKTLDGFSNSILVDRPEEDKVGASFDSLLNSAMQMIRETNDYSNEAAEAELSYAMGITNSTHELQVAQMKANVSLQYTVAVRNAVMDAYKEIMQLQF
ncbi:MAG: flagellar hook-basal body complex protein FliE [Lachnospiraceae bacterium]|nr:flagellar hook-basal body complex protein FliE [Lachnospiraceae bacterium]